MDRPLAAAALPLGRLRLPVNSPSERLRLLDGGAEAFPRMIEAIHRARVWVHLEVYTFAHTGWGARFVEALIAAAARGVQVRVIVDGWGSVEYAPQLRQALAASSVQFEVYNPLFGMLQGRFRRNHRKMLVVDDDVAFVGGINIEDRYADSSARAGWADVALEMRGAPCVWLGRRLRGEEPPRTKGTVRVHLSGVRGSKNLQKRYLKLFAHAQQRVLLAQAYFLPGPRLVRAILKAAGRGVKIVLLLTAKSDVPGVRAAMVREYHRLLSHGVEIHEWTESVLHAKAAVADGRRLIVGSFNLDPFSVANLESLVECVDPALTAQGEEWIASRVARARKVTLAEYSGGNPLVRWWNGVLGEWVYGIADWISRLLAAR